MLTMIIASTPVVKPVIFRAVIRVGDSGAQASRRQYASPQSYQVAVSTYEHVVHEWGTAMQPVVSPV